MVRKWMVPVFAALALVMLLSGVALAADPPAAPAYAGQCANFVDADGDGLCDNAGQQLGQRNGAGQGTGQGQNGSGTFVDADGDGVCDNLGQNTPARTGARNQNGQRGGRR